MDDFILTSKFVVTNDAPIGSSEEELFFAFYVPITGIKAFALYSLLLHLPSKVDLSFNRVLSEYQLSRGDFLEALRPLEALGLLKRYKKGEDYYLLHLLPPKRPLDFFASPLLSGIFQKYAGQEKFEELQRKYLLPKEILKGNEVSTSFRDFFRPDNEEALFLNSPLIGKKHSTNPLKTGFDVSIFLECVKNDERFPQNFTFQDQDLEKIGEYAALYGYSEEALSDFVYESFDSKTRIVDYAKLSEILKNNLNFKAFQKNIRSPKISGDFSKTSLGKVLERMEKFSPVEFLSYLQKGSSLAPSDLKLLEYLTVEMGLTSAATNALVFYVISTNNNVLSYSLTTKIAASLLRKDIKTAIDALDYLKNNKRKKGKVEKSIEKRKEAPLVSGKKNESEKEMSEEEFEDLVKNL